MFWRMTPELQSAAVRVECQCAPVSTNTSIGVGGNSRKFRATPMTYAHKLKLKVFVMRLTARYCEVSLLLYMVVVDGCLYYLSSFCFARILSRSRRFFSAGDVVGDASVSASAT
ncbi:hypothetical protein BO85DRAFT_195939 [Aspergillus piperis CBS 112811]|uniref:Uncharacterized protein n=1 Tax=Aspergillus piperis CBS 112811 TaxID=1448313 RepID=A0A8G1VPX7_9EURO|nr:hypothetical protein BO85DRAFT_195939 [Aspergillus piperis CBS 112811]RAH61414.1 hypothetical protein BO85DRAFT_195939 [Aspergillus piperis CBS 112811]